MLKAKDAATAVTRTEALRKIGVEARRLETAKPRMLTDLQRAKMLQVTTAALKLPIVLSPAHPVKGKSNLTVYTSVMVEPTYPAGSGQALFSSSFQGAVFPGAQVAFPRVKKGKNHLVEFHVMLFGDTTYNFRVFDYPMGGFQDVAVPGGQAHIFTVLAPPIDEISGSLELGAGIQQRDPKSEAAGWALYSVRISTTL